jgi:hypothetical protein
VPGARAAETRELGTLGGGRLGSLSYSESAMARSTLGSGSIEESDAPLYMQWPPLADWPVIRPSGPEPLDPSGLGFIDIDFNKALSWGATIVLGWWAIKEMKKMK